MAAVNASAITKSRKILATLRRVYVRSITVPAAFAAYSNLSLDADNDVVDLASSDRPLVSIWFQDLFHSPSWGSFHLSLTVLVHYRSLRSI